MHAFPFTGRDLFRLWLLAQMGGHGEPKGGRREGKGRTKGGQREHKGRTKGGQREDKGRTKGTLDTTGEKK